MSHKLLSKYINEVLCFSLNTNKCQKNTVNNSIEFATAHNMVIWIEKNKNFIKKQ